MASSVYSVYSVVCTLKDHALYLYLRIVAEIHEESEPESRHPEVVDELRLVLCRQIGGCFEFDDDVIIADKIRSIGLPQPNILVKQFQLRLRNVWDAPTGEF